MKTGFYILLISFLFYSCNTQDKATDTDFNFDWKFKLTDTDHAELPDFSDADWRTVNLPHDWSVEHAFTQEQTSGATAWLPGGIGWYRKTFLLPQCDTTKMIHIEFDGVYNNSEVWINGNKLGKRPYGYVPFHYDLTPYLNFGSEKNVIAVRVDRSAHSDCRWYSGSGIYRKVKLVRKNKVHIPQWGIGVQSKNISQNHADIAIQTKLSNFENQNKSIVLESNIYFKNKRIASVRNPIDIKPGETISHDEQLMIKQAKLWDTKHPNMYSLVSKVYSDQELIDSVVTKFGVRYFNFDKDKGFFLNGKQTTIKGVCLHHDGGLVGAAVPKGVWERRLQALKELGCNAIRTAHNPPSEEFLELCDEMGFLVQDEAFDEWHYPKDKIKNFNQEKESKETKGYSYSFEEWAEKDIKNMILRDRNHPSIFMWSIGNEIEWTFPRYQNVNGYWGKNKIGDVNYYWDEPPLSVKQIKQNFKSEKGKKYNLANTARNLVKWVKSIDTSRVVTANLVIPSVSNFSGYADALDVVGLSYRRAVYDYCKKNYPEKIFLGTENWTQYHDWKAVLDRDFISGLFVWTGIDYMGESRKWPVRGSSCGLLDFAGFKKASYHMFKCLWNKEPHVYITTQLLSKSPYRVSDNSNDLIEKEKDWANHQKWGWHSVNEHWNYTKGDTTAVEVYTNQNEMELFLNGKSQGIRKLKDNKDHILKWSVIYEDGILEAKVPNGSISSRLETAGNVKTIELKADKTEILANADDVVHFVVQLKDAEANSIRDRNKLIEFEVTGPAKILGVDNGAPDGVQVYQTNQVKTSSGRCLLLIQSTLDKGTIRVKAKSGNMESSAVMVKVN